MQRITLICVGKMGLPFCAAGVAEYQKRLGGLCRFAVAELPEEPLREKAASAAVVAAALAKEGARILAAVPKGAVLAALCVEGKQLASEDFSRLLADAALRGEGHMAFAIGSSHGLADAVKNAAAYRISLSAMTLPHDMARLVLCEQIYRAMQIRAGTRYHK